MAVDELNASSYAYHYRNLDSTVAFAQRAYERSADYPDGKAEALNNLAFADIMRMDYAKAKERLDAIPSCSDNQLELLVSYVQQMRLCQRMSDNRAFYDYRGKALSAQERLAEDNTQLTERQQYRLHYAESELAIVTSTYYYYIGQERQSAEALNSLDNSLEGDTAQFLNYLYNMAAGGMVSAPTQAEVNQTEFDYLMRCLLLSEQAGYPFFEANSLEALAEHFIDTVAAAQLIADNLPAMKFLADSHDSTSDFDADGEFMRELPTLLAQHALEAFSAYGDVYQIAGAYRTLASCYLAQGDYHQALQHLFLSLADSTIRQAPDLVASIREQLSVAYAAIDSMELSTRYRQSYLQLQQETRQDRSREARALQLDATVSQLNKLIFAVVGAIVLLMALLVIVYYQSRRAQKKHRHIDNLIQPLRDWEQANQQEMHQLSERNEELGEQLAQARLHIETNERRNLEQRAKISLVNSITPFIDRILYEVRKSPSSSSPIDKTYVCELVDQINEQNDVLTHWIQLRQGELNLHIETFPLQQLFDIVGKSKTGFELKGVSLSVQPTEARVKADKVLTLFMINTLADNARKFTAQGGTVSISAQEASDYIEIAVEDTGEGIAPERLPHIFDHTVTGGHGFGLMNCKGIIEKYRKISSIFSVCHLGAESQVGKGSRFFFRLPKGIMRLLLLLLGFAFTAAPSYGQEGQEGALEALTKAGIYCDSATQSNNRAKYEQALLYADTCRQWLNRHYLLTHPYGTDTLLAYGSMAAPSAELLWYHEGLDTHYDQILTMRNASAIAALALHQWNVYNYNNRIYTLLYKEISSDSSLDDYCRTMQQSQSNKQIAIILLVVLLIAVLPVFYLLYFRHRLHYRFCVEHLKAINSILLSDVPDAEKSTQIAPLLSERYPEPLQSVVSQIQQSLGDSVVLQQSQLQQIELTEEELQRATLEEGNLHVSNAVLDNCLSTLKHETMYYPSRIRQLLYADDAAALEEVTAYYRELYGILSVQAQRQIDHVKLHLQALDYGILGDRNLVAYLFDILRKQSGGAPLSITATPKDQRYVELRIPMPALQLSEAEAARLFVPSIENIPYLLCRQIVRDHGEATGRRGCGIWAEQSNNLTTIIITLPLCNHSK